MLHARRASASSTSPTFSCGGEDFSMVLQRAHPDPNVNLNPDSNVTTDEARRNLMAAHRSRRLSENTAFMPYSTATDKTRSKSRALFQTESLWRDSTLKAVQTLRIHADSTTLLMRSCASGQLEIAKMLVEDFGVDINSRSKCLGRTALMKAVSFASIPFVRQLLIMGAAAICEDFEEIPL